MSIVPIEQLVCYDCQRSTSGMCWRHPRIIGGASAPMTVRITTSITWRHQETETISFRDKR